MASIFERLIDRITKDDDKVWTPPPNPAPWARPKQEQTSDWERSAKESRQSSRTQTKPKASKPKASKTEWRQGHNTVAPGAKAPKDLPARVSDAFEPVSRWLDTETRPKDPIPAGKDRFGDDRIRSGVSDPYAYEQYQSSGVDPGPTSVIERMFLPPRPLTPGREPTEEEMLASSFDTGKDFSKSYLTLAEIINDVNTRLGQARRWQADDPFTDEDNPAYEYTLPNGETYRGPSGKDDGDLVHFWRIKDGTVLAETDFPKTAEPDGTVRLPDGRRVPADWLSVGPEDFHHSEFPDGTPFSTPEGTVPDAVKDAPRREADSSILGLGLSDPRSPVENTSGDFIWEKDYWEDAKRLGLLENSTIDETPAWLVDMTLNSVPYFIPGYNIASGVSRAAPYLFGYSGNTYMPEGRGLDNLRALGKGTYKDEELANSQIVGGMLAPLLDAWAERAGGGAFGGPLREGAEEVVSTLPQQMSEERWGDIGREYTVNDLTGEKEYDPSTPRFGTLPENLASDFFGGFAMGAEFDLLNRAAGLAGRGGRGGRGGEVAIPSYVDRPPVAPSMPSEEDLDRMLKTLGPRRGGDEGR